MIKIDILRQWDETVIEAFPDEKLLDVALQVASVTDNGDIELKQVLQAINAELHTRNFNRICNIGKGEDWSHQIDIMIYCVYSDAEKTDKSVLASCAQIC